MSNFQQASSGNYSSYASQYTSGASYDKYMQQYAGKYTGTGGYDKYMSQYAGGSDSYQKYSQKYSGGQQQTSTATQANSATDLVELKDKSQSQQSSSSSYEKYMKQYAGASGGYQKYMKQYAGSSGGYDKYMKQYAGGSNGGGYDTYMKQYASKYMNKNWTQTQTNLNAIPNPEDAKTKEELDTWKEAQQKKLEQFVPAAYVKYADKTLDQQYKQRLNELENATGSSEASEADESSAAGDVLSKLYQNFSSIDLIEKAPTKGTKEQDEVAELRNSSKAGVEKVEKLVEDLRHAAKDSAATDQAAAMPTKKVKAKFSHRRTNVTKTIKTLQAKVDTNSDVSESELTDAEELIEKLGTDQRKALRTAHAGAYKQSMHAARGIQSKAREEARKVETKTNRLARISRSDQDYATELQNRVEAATDKAEEQGELLARKAEDSLEQHLNKAQDEVRQQEQNDLETLHDLRVRVYSQASSTRSEKTSSEKVTEGVSKSQGAANFLAQRVANSSPNSHSASGLIACGVAAVALVSLYAKFRRRSAEPKAGLLGYSAISD
jgi:hypothetical protein